MIEMFFPEIDKPECVICGKRIEDREAIYLTQKTTMKRVRRSKYLPDDAPIIVFCTDCIPDDYIKAAIRYNFVYPNIYTIEEMLSVQNKNR